MAKGNASPRAKSRRREPTITFASLRAVQEFEVALNALGEGYHDFSHQFDDLEQGIQEKAWGKFPAKMKIGPELVEAAHEARLSAVAMSAEADGVPLGLDDIEVEGDNKESIRPGRRLWVVIDLSWGDKTILGATAWSSEQAARKAADAIETLGGSIALVSAALDIGLSKDS